MDKDMYTTEEAASHLGITVGRVRQMIVDGVLQTKRFGRAHVITKDALKVVAHRRTKPGPAPKATTQPNGTKRSNGTATKRSAAKKARGNPIPLPPTTWQEQQERMDEFFETNHFVGEMPPSNPPKKKTSSASEKRATGPKRAGNGNSTNKKKGGKK